MTFDPQEASLSSCFHMEPRLKESSRDRHFGQHSSDTSSQGMPVGLSSGLRHCIFEQRVELAWRLAAGTNSVDIKL